MTSLNLAHHADPQAAVGSDRQMRWRLPTSSPPQPLGASPQHMAKVPIVPFPSPSTAPRLACDCSVRGLSLHPSPAATAQLLSSNSGFSVGQPSGARQASLPTPQASLQLHRQAAAAVHRATPRAVGPRAQTPLPPQGTSNHTTHPKRIRSQEVWRRRVCARGATRPNTASSARTCTSHGKRLPHAAAHGRTPANQR